MEGQKRRESKGMWLPQRVYFEEKALDYRRGREMLDTFKEYKVPVEVLAKGGRVKGITGETPLMALKSAKKTLVVRVHKAKDFPPCKPSAHYQLPLSSSCPGRCEYCYLYTNLGKKPYLRAYVNVEEILAQAEAYVKERSPQVTLFEGSATSDPLPLEPFTGSLAETITFFGRQEHGRFRFVTKFTGVESLLSLKHNHHTRFRFSVNSEKAIAEYEHGTPSLAERLKALTKTAAARYPIGLIIAPVFLDEGWQEQYKDLLVRLAQGLSSYPDLTLEIILHRFTSRARSAILDLYPETGLPMEEENRRFKYGQFGYGKYVYPKELYREAEEFFLENIRKLLPLVKIEYLV
jgi:spore photoproduct lyase